MSKERKKEMEKKKSLRRAGVLLPVSSLPSDCGIGTLGAGAYAFVDWLSSANMKIWQVLPLLPTGYGDSPYQSCASNALNPYFIDFALLEKDGLLERADWEDIEWSEDIRRVDYGKQFACKTHVLKKAYARFDKTNENWLAFLKEGKYNDYALFMTLKTKFSYAPWTDWPEPYKNCEGTGLEEYIEENAEEIGFWLFTQYIFLKQWNALRAYAKERGVSIMGDMPIYVSADSVETWKYRRQLFALDKEGNLSMRAGVPPDAFSEDGQLWGNPVYDWERLKKDGYAWWKERIQYAFSLFDMVRIDHFRAFDRFYAIPDGAETAKEGEWLDGPKAELFKGMKKYSIVAEDLGTIDDGVRKLMEDTGFPGMKVFEFAFDGNPENEYLPIYYEKNCVAYTGTHDNDTLRSFLEEMPKMERKEFEKELEKQCLALDSPYVVETIEDECKSIMELLLASNADTVIFPMHDIAVFGEEARLNAPSTVSAQNWTFRFIERDFGQKKAAWLQSLTQLYKR
ncbi:MAG: 4-alpha-glucanotransferase [Clostridia bacterium]|nr:4-alpha-glucanotransferase [Clostridia bacterium]